MKIARILLLLVLFPFNGQREYRKSEPRLWITEQEALTFYYAYNSEYFEGVLPRVEIHFLHDLKDMNGKRAIGLTYRGNPYRMYLDAKYQDTPLVVLETVVHEMCHITLDSSRFGPEHEDHGPRWQNCMLRVAEHGGFRGIW